MKQLILALLMVSSIAMYAKTITKTFQVKGECGLCKEKIETALDIPGVSFAEWNKETKMLTVRYNDKKVSEDDIHTTISNLGYATNKVAANANSQSKLDKCCQPKVQTKACGTKTGCCSKKK